MLLLLLLLLLLPCLLQRRGRSRLLPTAHLKLQPPWLLLLLCWLG
jgi:hypothetical protein